MNKQEFIFELRRGLSGLPSDEVEERIAFYIEMIDDRIDEGMSEEEAISAIGSVEDIVQQILKDIPLFKIVKNKAKMRRRLSAWEIVLIVLGSPIWFSLLVTAFAVVFSLYAVFWSLIISLWAVWVSLVACSIAGIFVGAVFGFTSNVASGIFMIGAGFVIAGLSIFLFLGCKGATKGAAELTKKIAFGIKKMFTKKEVEL